MIAAQSSVSWSDKLLGKTVAENLTAFVVPGVELLRQQNIDLNLVNINITTTPRHANVLLLVGEIPTGLKEYALTIYNQMPSPKAVFAINVSLVGLPFTPDVFSDGSTESMAQAIKKLQERFANNHPNLSLRGGFEQPKQSHEMLNQVKNDNANAHDMEYSGHEGMEEEEMGFMSMVMMTENLPKSPDGLRMEWAQVHFGPLFAGLPAGLDVTFMLDGDSVVETEVSVESVRRDLGKKWLGEAQQFVETFSKVDPLLPKTYQILALMVLEDAANKIVDQKVQQARKAVLAKEALISDLNWLTLFAALIHYPRFKTQAEHFLYQAQNAQTSEDIALLQKTLKKFTSTVTNRWLLKKRLSGIGMTNNGRDVWRRLLDKVSEVSLNLNLLTEQAEELAEQSVAIKKNTSGKGKAIVQTPRGSALLSIEVKNGRVSQAVFLSPSEKKLEQIPHLVENLEVADALIAVASLDISPWEVAL